MMPQQPFQPPPYGGGLQPSRKDMIMILTIMGWVVCGILCFVSFFMAKQDLEQIDAGVMEARDRETINLLKIVSMVNMGITLAAVLFGCCYIGFVFFAVGASAAGAGGGY